MAIPKRLRKPLIPAIIAFIALGVWAEVWYSRQSPLEQTRFINPVAPSETPAPTANAAPSQTAAPALAPVTSAPPDEAAMVEIDKVSLMLRDYRTIAGENPVGTNAEIMAAVMGENPKQAKLGPPEGMKLNEKGELIDRWGTPYFFHQISRDHMEIRSAGPDKVLWTQDDPVVR